MKKPQPPRPVTTVTRSVSFDEQAFEIMEADRTGMPERDRSQYIRELLEERYFGVPSRPLSPSAKAMVAAILKKTR